MSNTHKKSGLMSHTTTEPRAAAEARYAAALATPKYPNVIAAMEAAQIDIKKFAQDIGITAKQAENMFISGTKPVFTEIAWKVSVYYNMPIDVLFDRKPRAL